MRNIMKGFLHVATIYEDGNAEAGFEVTLDEYEWVNYVSDEQILEAAARIMGGTASDYRIEAN